MTGQNVTEQDIARPDAVAAILAAPTITAAADELGVARSTVYRWLENAAFRDDLARARSQAFDAALARLEAGFDAIVSELQRIATNPAVKPSTRVGACRAFIDAAFRSRETITTAERIHELETVVAGLRGEIETARQA